MINFLINIRFHCVSWFYRDILFPGLRLFLFCQNKNHLLPPPLLTFVLSVIINRLLLPHLCVTLFLVTLVRKVPDQFFEIVRKRLENREKFSVIKCDHVLPQTHSEVCTMCSEHIESESITQSFVLELTRHPLESVILT